jgi:hypothetical protein
VTRCAAWTYSEAWATNCITCPAWKYCEVWETTPKSCAINTYSESWAWDCTSCPINSTTNSLTEQTSINACLWGAGYRNCEDEICNVVEMWYYSSANSNSRTACTNGPSYSYYTWDWLWTNDCPWDCDPLYIKDGNNCVSNSRTQNCSALWTWEVRSSTSTTWTKSITQTTTDLTNRTPSTTKSYNTYTSSSYCYYKCNTWYTRNTSSSKCVTAAENETTYPYSSGTLDKSWSYSGGDAVIQGGDAINSGLWGIYISGGGLSSPIRKVMRLPSGGRGPVIVKMGSTWQVRMDNASTGASTYLIDTTSASTSASWTIERYYISN